MSDRSKSTEAAQRRPRLFGTDGVRGVFGTHPLDQSTVRTLAAALGETLGRKGPSPRVVLGGDTRDSTPILCRWLASELVAQGVDATFLGTVPTPCVAHATTSLGAVCGIAVSASHNPHPDNGIKLIDGRGFKWTPTDEAALEATMETVAPRTTTDSGAELEADPKPVEDWLRHLAAGLEGDRPLAGLSLALDTGNGAASPYARRLFEGLGATVSVLHDQPDGSNINAGCGSTHPEVLATEVRRIGADLGFSFDGDADRVIVADESGTVRDGDAILYLWGLDLARRDALPGRRIVATSMSNLGLEVALRREGIELLRCDVGDREVVATMERSGTVLGGEQSGHIVHRGSSTTGDGLLTALHVAALRRRADQSLSALLTGFERFPQLIHNLRVRHKPPLDTLPEVVAAQGEVEAALGDQGRLVLRYSGTEPLVRIMIEGPEQGPIEALAQQLAGVLEEQLA